MNNQHDTIQFTLALENKKPKQTHTYARTLAFEIRKNNQTIIKINQEQQKQEIK